MFFVFCIEVLRKATICPAFFPATFNWTGEFSRRTITFLNARDALKRDEDRLDSGVTCGMRADTQRSVETTTNTVINLPNARSASPRQYTDAIISFFD